MKGFSFLANILSVSAVIQGVNYFGLETPRKDFDCTWKHPIDYYIDQLHNTGFNHLRVPFSLEYVNDGNWQNLDYFFEVIQRYPTINVTLDMHRIFASHQGADPFEGGTTLTQFVNGWVIVLQRYQDIPQLVGVDVFNEYQGTDAVFWNSILSQIVTQIENTIPERFIFFVGGTRWGGSLVGIDLEYLNFNDRIFYTIHKYIFSGTPSEQDWEYSFSNHINKTSVGEWGFFSEQPEQVAWAQRLISWLKSKNIRDTFFWCDVANSGDTGGLYKSDCETFDWYKLDIIKTLWNS
jgi:endoglucanase